MDSNGIKWKSIEIRKATRVKSLTMIQFDETKTSFSIKTWSPENN